MHKMKDWSTHIVRHVWHCANVCRKDETTTDTEALKVMKVSNKDSFEIFWYGHAYFLLCLDGNIERLQFYFLGGHMYVQLS